MLDRIEQEFTNQWGLVHTREREERVWTLPTGLLVLAQLHYGRTKHALQFLNNIALTARQGMLGAFKELIPEGLCFVQLWSAGLYVQCVVEGLLGLHPRAHEHQLTIAPTLPDTWHSATIAGLRVGEHLLNITVGATECYIDHISGSQALHVHFNGGTTVAALNITGSIQNKVSVKNDKLMVDVPVGQHVDLHMNAGVAKVEYKNL